jgi:DNA-binding YbaB/EbfC family protein
VPLLALGPPDLYFPQTLQALSDTFPMADWQQLIQLSQQMQGRLQQLQHDLAEKTYDAQAGGGLVRITVDGKGSIRSLQIDPMAFEGRDSDLLADLILGAIAEGQRRAADALQQEMRRLAPLSPNLPL